jgi:ABC-type glycerol-3-phosphate transport system permease component
VKRRHIKQILICIVLAFFLVLTFVPFLMMVLLSFKSNAEIYANFWGAPRVYHFEHYIAAFRAVIRYIGNSLVVCAVSTLGVIFLSSLTGYVFARHEFPFKKFLFLLVISLLMIPGILTLIPMFLLVKRMGLLNTRWALILPYISGGQIFGILLCRTFISEIPRDLFDAARIDGASEFRVYTGIVVPLSLPILATIGIMTGFSIYNDFIWPLIAISDNSRQVFTVALTVFAGEYRLDMGPVLAGYTIGCIPLLILIAFGMKYFIKGVTSGALKA